MTSARVQPFCRKYNINIGYFDGTRMNPRNNTQRNASVYIHSNHFCLNCISEGFSFNQVIEDELKQNLNVVDSVISVEHVKSYLK